MLNIQVYKHRYKQINNIVYIALTNEIKYLLLPLSP